MFIKTTGTAKILKLRKRIRGVAGGTSASKTISILLWLIDYAQSTNGKLISVVSETFPHLKRGAIRDFMNIMEEHQYFKRDEWNKTDFIYTFSTGSKIEFFSADQPSKVRGPRRDILFINEANNIPYETYTQLEIRTKDIIWLDWNPVSEFWFYEEILGKTDCDFIKLTYKDNEALHPNIVQAIEARRGNKNWWRVYGEGELGVSEGRIYTNWKQIDEIPHEARLERYGLDFGYSNDPSAIVAVYYYNGGYILDEILYRKGLSNKQLADILLNQKTSLTVADSAEPKSIDEIISYGISIIPATKGQGSVLQGIQYVQDQQISVTTRSLNIWKEYRNYLWQTDKDGKIINTPEDIFNHCFVGNTEIRTIDGFKQIKDVKKGDWVVTSQGIKPVLKKWNNGIKQVVKYSLQFDTFSVMLEATPDHKIKTTKGWKKISQLQSGTEIYHNNYLGVKSTDFIQKKDISREDQGVCTQKCGNTTRVQFLKDFMYTTKMKILGTTEYLILNLLNGTHTCPNILKRGLKTILNGQNLFKKRELLVQKSGTEVKMGKTGTVNTEKEHGLTDNIEYLTAYSAGMNTKQGMAVYPNIAIQTARLKHLGVGESRKERVYDLTVEGVHEYFANGILVHNCMDAIRYAFTTLRPNTEEIIDLPNDTETLFEGGYY